MAIIPTESEVFKDEKNTLIGRKRNGIGKVAYGRMPNDGRYSSKAEKLFAETVEQMLEAEMDKHLRYEKNSVEGNNSGNNRNGCGKNDRQRLRRVRNSGSARQKRRI